MLGRALVSTGVVAVVLATWIGCGGSADSSTLSRPTDGGSDTSSSSTTDANESTPDAGHDGSGGETDLGPAATVTYGTCPAFTACGGNVEGTWKVTGGCVSDQTFADLKQGACAGIQESDVVIKAAGTLTATATTIARHTKVDVTAKVFVPQECVDSFPSANCSLVELALTTDILGTGSPPPFDTANCADGAGGCNCTAAKTLTENTTSDYTASGSTISLSNPDRTFDYCVESTKLTLQETTTSGEYSFPIIVELQKQ